MVKKEAEIARLATIAVVDSKARAEDDLARVQEALTIMEEARHKVETETVLLEVK